MIIDNPSGARWHIQEPTKRLALRARFPGARVFDLVANSIRAAKAAGVSAQDRFFLALPASWLVNSPAISRVLRRWALPPDRDAWLGLLELLENGEIGLLEEATRTIVRGLGTEPYVIEAVSKILALLVPELVPLMPPPALAFVLGEGAPADEAAFVRMIEWFQRESKNHALELSVIARGHKEVALVGPQVLDRLLWFDSDGYRHFENEGLGAVKVTKNA